MADPEEWRVPDFPVQPVDSPELRLVEEALLARLGLDGPAGR